MNAFSSYRINQDGGQISSRLEQVTLDELSPGEVVIRVVYSSVNYKDALAATGDGKIVRNFPRVGGIDASGYVLSSTDTQYKEGDAVLVTGYDFGVDHDGGYAEYARVPAEWIVPLPEGLSLRDAMVLGTAGFTVGLAVQRLQDNGQQPEQGPLLITGASGGVGTIAVNVFAKLGYQVMALTSKDEQHDYLRSLGAEQILSRHLLELGERSLERGYWAGGLDTVGSEILSWFTRSTKPWGNIVCCGMAAGNELNTSVMPFILRGVSLLGVTSSNCPLTLRHRIWQRLADDLRPPNLNQIVQREVELEQLPEIFNSLLNGQIHGRTLVRISSED